MKPDIPIQSLVLSADEFRELRDRGIVTADGRAALRSQNVIIKRGQPTEYPPYAFTEKRVFPGSGRAVDVGMLPMTGMETS